MIIWPAGSWCLCLVVAVVFVADNACYILQEIQHSYYELIHQECALKWYFIGPCSAMSDDVTLLCSKSWSWFNFFCQANLRCFPGAPCVGTFAALTDWPHSNEWEGCVFSCRAQVFLNAALRGIFIVSADVSQCHYLSSHKLVVVTILKV